MAANRPGDGQSTAPVPDSFVDYDDDDDHDECARAYAHSAAAVASPSEGACRRVGQYAYRIEVAAAAPLAAATRVFALGHRDKEQRGKDWSPPG